MKEARGQRTEKIFEHRRVKEDREHGRAYILREFRDLGYSVKNSLGKK
jgi:hypothetical protein